MSKIEKLNPDDWNDDWDANIGIKNLERAIDAKIQEYRKDSKGDSIDMFLEYKGMFVAQLSYIGQKEADLHERKVIDENTYEVEKNGSYKRQRELNKKSIEDSKVESKLESAGAELEMGLSTAAYKRASHLRERVHKVIDAISQRVAVLRKEKDASQ